MFHSFFPRPKLFFSFGLLVTVLAMLIWFIQVDYLKERAGLNFDVESHLPAYSVVEEHTLTSLGGAPAEYLIKEIAKERYETYEGEKIAFKDFHELVKVELADVSSDELLVMLSEIKYEVMVATVALGDYIGSALFGFEIPTFMGEPVIGLGYFVTDSIVWFYLFSFFWGAVIAIAWKVIVPNNPWYWWSVIGTGVLIFFIHFGVQVDVALNHWSGPFFTTIQQAFNHDGSVTANDIYGGLVDFTKIAAVAIWMFVVNRFFTSHYVFRWRTAMNEYYTSKLKYIRGIEGASQRIQEDTMRFASIVESLGVEIVESVMTLIAFLPLLLALSEIVTVLPIIGEMDNAVMKFAVFWSLFGIVLMIVAGLKLPGLQYNNQKVEAAYRKELVYGEDDPDRANPITLKELYANVRKNYYRIYKHYSYFNMFRSLYNQTNGIIVYVIMVPTIIGTAIAYGTFQQILRALGRVTSSFQVLVHSWSTIIELMSIHKRLHEFEKEIDKREAAEAAS